MKLILLTLCLLSTLVIPIGCKNGTPLTKREPLTQEKAQDAVRAYVTMHGFEHLDQVISGGTIQKYEKLEMESDGNASMKVYFKSQTATEPLGIIFIFGHTSPDRWAIKSLQAESSASNELNQWLENKRNLNVPVK
ncbi:MAG: hypothetical protein ABIQ02_10140 [Saprospiraceae bacterium]